MLPSLRILHVTPYFGDAWAYGGIPRVVQAMAAGLVGRGHLVSVCTTDARDATRRLDAPAGQVAWSTRDAASGAAVHVFPNASNRLAYHAQLFLPRGLQAFLRERAHDFDVAHLHACRNLPGVIAARQLRAAGVPYVLGPNGTAPNIERRQAAKYVFDRLFGRQLLNDASRVLAVSAAERTELVGLGVPRSRIADVPNPIDLDEFSMERPSGACRGSAELGSAPVVLFLGKLTPRKRVDVLVRAFARIAAGGGPLADARLVIAGNDMGAGPALRSLVHRLGLDARTTFTGLLEGAERLHALADADVVVYPSEDEAFGLVPLESLLAGTAVIVSDDSGCGEIISRIGGGLTVRPGDVEALTRAIASVLVSNVVSREDVDAAATRIRSEFSAAAVCATLEDQYRQVIEEQRLAGPDRRVRRDAA